MSRVNIKELKIAFVKKLTQFKFPLKEYWNEFSVSSQFKYMIYGFGVIVIIFLGIILTPGVKERLFPNSWISEKYAEEGLYSNINPGFKVEFGDKEDTSTQIVRFETKASNSNPFQDSEYEDVGFWQKVKEFFLGKEKKQITMTLKELSVSDVLGVDSKYATTTTDIETTTQLRDLSRTFSDYFNEVEDDGSVEKDTVLNENVVDGVDVEYQIIDGIGLKEEIVVNWKDEFSSDCSTDCEIPANSFVFNLVLDEGVELHKSMATTQNNPQGTYYFTDENGRYIAHFLPSFAVDNVGSKTNNVDFDIEKTEGQPTYKIRITVNSAWMMSENRVFPIRIDPSIVHDTEGEFDAGSVLNRVESVSGPQVQLVEQEMISDINTVGLWHMNENSGSSVADSSGNSNNGSATGTTVVTGIFDDSRGFNGSSDLISVTDATTLKPSTAFSIEGWIYPTALPTSGNVAAIAYKNTSSTSGWGFGLYNNSGTMSMIASVRTGTWTEFYPVYSFSLNTWYHVAYMYDGSQMFVYVNGVLIGTQNKTGAITSSANALTFGSSVGGGNYFTGRIDEVRISNIARTPEEIKANAQKRPYGTFISDTIDLSTNLLSIDDLQWTENGVTTGDGETTYSSTNLVAQWNFNETSGIVATDSITGTAPPILGGTVTDVGGYRIHKFTTSGSFVVPTGAGRNVEILVVAGGGGGGSNRAGGGGAGGLVYNASFAVTAQTYTVTVGAGGNNASQATNAQGDDGDNSVFDSITATGGGGGGGGGTIAGRNGGSGGGGGASGAAGGAGGTGSQGYNGGSPTSNWRSGAGGGGAGAVGANSTTSGGAGGNGLSTYSALLIAANAGVDISGTRWIAGGGGGGTDIGTTFGAGGNGGGGAGTKGTANGVAGTANSGGGGGGCGDTNKGGNGGSGIVIIRYSYTSAGSSGTLVGFASTGSQDTAPGTGWTSDNRRWGAGALMFDGVDDYVNIDNYEAHKFSNTDSFSIEAWFRTKGEDDGSVEDYLIGRRESGKYTYALYLGTDSKINFGIYDGTNSPTASSITSVGDSKWHHVAGVRDVSADKLYLYVDGILQQETTDTTTTTIATDNPGTIGCAYQSGACIANTFFNGVIDSTRIYSRALTSTEILSNYNTGNIEFLTRTSVDEITWEAWKPTSGESNLDSSEDSISNWSILGTNSSIDTYNTYAYTVSPSGPTGCVSNKHMLVSNISNSEALTNYQIDTSISYEVGMSTDFTNIRFTNASGANLDYFIDSYVDSTSANLVVEVDSIPANGYTSIYLWYNSCSGGNSSSATNTYLLYDDFSTFDSGKWTTTGEGTVDVTGGYVYPTDYGTGTWHGPVITADLSSAIESNEGFIFETSVYWQNVSSDLGNFKVGLSESGTDSYYARFYDSHSATGESAEYLYAYTTGLFSSCTGLGEDCLVAATWTPLKMIKNPSSTLQYLKNSVSRYNGTPAHYASNEVSITFQENTTYNPVTLRVDYVKVRRYTYPSPMISDTFPPVDPVHIYGNGSQKIQIGYPLVDIYTVGLWHLDETNGDNAGYDIFDATSNNNDGEFVGSNIATAVENGINGKARRFNGSDDYIDVGDGATLDASSTMTWEAWFYNTSSNNYSIMFKRVGTSEYAQYAIQADATSIYCLQSSTGSAWATLVTATRPTQNTWHHIACTNNGSAANMYIDGAYVATDATPATSLAASTASLNIGFGRGSSANTYFTGIIDDVKISNTARSANEIAEVYRAGRDHLLSATFPLVDLSTNSKLPFWVASDRQGTFLEASIGETSYANYLPNVNTVGIWQFEEQSGSGAYLEDSSGNDNDGTPTGTTFIQGKIGKARYFDNSNDVVNLGSGASFDFGNNGAFTHSGWIKSTTLGDYDGFVSKVVAARNGTYSYMTVLMANGRLSAYTGAAWVDVCPAGSVTSGTWYHIAFVYDGTNMKGYVNGKVCGSVAFTYTDTAAHNVFIGSWYVTTQAYDFYGLIDEVRISNIARTADEIRQEYEYDLRTYPITIDFKAALNSGGTGALISNGTDLAFTIDSTSYGASQLGANLYEGDKVVVKENIDGTEYIAQGDVSAIAVATGETTVSSWDATSSFPSGGFTSNATVFKWQREFFDITGFLSTHRDAITNITLRISDASQGATVWLDDFKYSTYLTDSNATANITSTAQRYLQYMAVFTTKDGRVTPYLSDVTVNYQNKPSLDQFMRHGMYFDNQAKQSFWWGP